MAEALSGVDTGVYARLQPAAADFQREVGDDVREVLEAVLARHSTLSEGDWLTAEHAGRAFDLRVQKLRPAAAVSVIGAPRSGAICCAAPFMQLTTSNTLHFWLQHSYGVDMFLMLWACRDEKQTDMGMWLQNSSC